MASRHAPPDPPGARYIYRAWRRCPHTGRKVWAKEHGLRAWRIRVDGDGTDSG